MSDKPTPEEAEDVKITDRRKFDRSGRLRDDLPSEPSAPAETRAAAPPPAAPEEKKSEAPKPPEREAPKQPAAATGPRPSGVDFQSFVYFLYMTALHELGVPTEQGSAPKPPDLERARFFIDVLVVMRDKTEGNLEAGETKMLDEVLANLQMQFVSLSGSPS